MNWVTAVTAGLALAGPALLGYVILLQIPAVQHSKFRHQLWAIRDDLVDDALAGRVQRDLPFHMLMALLENGIEDAKRHTMLAAFVEVRKAGHLVAPDIVNDIVLSGDAGRVRTRIAEYLERYRVVSRHHLYTGAPSGWLYWLGKQATRARQDLPKHAVEIEIAEAPGRRPELALGVPAIC